MKLLKLLAVGFGVLVAVLVLIGFLLPQTYHVERSLIIRAKPEQIHAQVDNLKQWPEWTAWTVARFPDMKIRFEGPESGEGAIYYWEGKQTGAGKLKLTASDPAKGVRYDLDFENGKYLSKGGLAYEATADGTRVTWSNDGDLGGNPINRWFGLMMDRMMGPDFATGLKNLQSRLETAKAP